MGDDLSPLAARALGHGWRHFDEPAASDRSAFRRDRDRIVHSQAFRRLAHKTQVFMAEEGDHYRTRLTHTIEVAQIARSLARNLNLDADLTEALALAHDLGHAPFGHTGEDALAELMAPHGGFEHNAHTLRIVTKLEQRYAAFDGLNLTVETLDGIIKHNGPLVTEAPAPDSRKPRDLPHALQEFLNTHPAIAVRMDLSTHAGLEAQLAAIADDIAYNTHDIDDGVRAGLFRLDDLRHIPLIRGILDAIDDQHPVLEPTRRMGELTRRLITLLIRDVDTTVRRHIQDLDLKTAQDVKDAGKPIALFSNSVAEDVWLVRAFLFKTVYRNASMLVLRSQADQVLRDLFRHFLAAPDSLPAEWRRGSDTESDGQHPRNVCDFIAGMTDRYALRLHAALFDDTPDLRYGAAV